MHRGYTKDFRKVKEWEWYKKPHMYHLFSHLIREANHKDGRWQGVEVKRGQLITGVKSLHSSTGISIQSIRTCLDRLKSTGEITIKSTTKYSIVTICKYDDYQSIEELPNKQTNKQPNTQLTNNQQTTNKQLTTNKNYNNYKKENNEEGVRTDIENISLEDIESMTSEEKAKRFPEIAKEIEAMGTPF